MHTQVSEQLFGRLGDFEKQLLQYVTKNRATIVAVVFLIFSFLYLLVFWHDKHYV